MNRIFRPYLAGLLAAGWLVGAQAAGTLIREVTIHWPDRAASVADVRIADGRIVDLGTSLEAMQSEEVIEGAQLHMTPGLVNSDTHLGLEEVSSLAETRDYQSDNPTITAALRVSDAFNPSSLLLLQNRIQGLTHALVLPESGGSLLAGQAAWVNLGATPDSVENPYVGMVVSLGETGQKLAGGSRAAAMALLREALEDARDYDAHRSDYVRGERRSYSLSRLDLEALTPVVRGEKPLLVRIHRAADIRQILKFAREQHIRVVLLGAEEAWLVARELADAAVPVVIDPMQNTPASFERLASRLDNAALLSRAGVRVLFTGIGWQNTHNAYLVRQAAGNAVANGMPYREALKAITVYPREVFSGHANPLEEGATADVVLWDGDPLEVTTEAIAVWVDGQRIPMRSHATELRDRYARKYHLVK
jgi:imidazolonepropionase-like amidohydrolase